MSRTILLPTIMLALVATAIFSAPAFAQSARPLFVAPDVVFPATGGVVRAGQNGLVIDEGVASVDESDQYSLLALSVGESDGVIRFTYGDAWTLAQPRPSSCVFTFRRVERALTQAGANDLAKSLAAIEMQTLKTGHPALMAVGDQQTSGAVVRQVVDRFTWSEDIAPAEGEAAATTATVFGLSKTWIFVLSAKPYYVNKTCFSWGTAAELTVIDQLIGLDYHRDPTT